MASEFGSKRQDNIAIIGPLNVQPTGSIPYFLQSTGVLGDLVLGPIPSGAIPTGFLPTGVYAPSGTLSASGIASASGIPTGYYAPTGTQSASGIPTGYYAPTGTQSASGIPTGYYAPTGIASASGIPTGLYAPTGILSASGIPTGLYAPTGTQSASGIPTGLWVPTGTYFGLSGVATGFTVLNNAAATLGQFNNINLVGLVGITGPGAGTFSITYAGGTSYALGSASYNSITFTGSQNFYGIGTMIGTGSFRLPTGPSAGPGTHYIIKDIMGTVTGPYALTISAPSGWNIDGQTGFIITTPYTSVDLISVATYTWIVN